MEEFLQLFVSGLTVGLTYSLVALGFVLIWKSSSVANLALGQLVLVFSWFAFAILKQVGLPIWLGLIVVMVFALAVGWVIERLILRRLIAQPLLSLITVTLGLAYFLEGIVHFFWPWSVEQPPFRFPAGQFTLGGTFSSKDLWVAVIALVIFGILSLYFRYHRMGIAMRATADDQLAVQACGIPVTSIFSQSWMFACVVAAAGGILISSSPPGIGYGLVEFGLKAFSVVILGGLDSFVGAIVAGPIIGLAESFGSGYLAGHVWPGIKDIIPFIIILVVMVVKPYGLFGERRIERI